jgi:hypothetical protein
MNLDIWYPADLAESIPNFDPALVIPCSAIFNKSIIGGLAFTLKPKDWKFFNLSRSEYPSPGLKLRMLHNSDFVYLLEIQFLFDNGTTLKSFFNPIHPTAKKLLMLLQKEKKIAFHFYDLKKETFVASYLDLLPDNMEWLERNINLINGLEKNDGWQIIDLRMFLDNEEHEKIFKFKDSLSIEKSFLSKHSNVVQLI